MEILEDDPNSNEAKLSGEEGQKEKASSSLSVTDEFMLAEYKKIFTAHFELYNAFRQMFRFYLGIVAVL